MWSKGAEGAARGVQIGQTIAANRNASVARQNTSAWKENAKQWQENAKQWQARAKELESRVEAAQNNNKTLMVDLENKTNLARDFGRAFEAVEDILWFYKPEMRAKYEGSINMDIRPNLSTEILETIIEEKESSAIAAQAFSEESLNIIQSLIEQIKTVSPSEHSFYSHQLDKLKNFEMDKSRIASKRLEQITAQKDTEEEKIKELKHKINSLYQPAADLKTEKAVHINQRITDLRKENAEFKIELSNLQKERDGLKNYKKDQITRVFLTFKGKYRLQDKYFPTREEAEEFCENEQLTQKVYTDKIAQLTAFVSSLGKEIETLNESLNQIQSAGLDDIKQAEHRIERITLKLNICNSRIEFIKKQY